MSTANKAAPRPWAVERRGLLARFLNLKTVVVGAVIICIGYLTVIPLYYIVQGTFRDDSGFTLSAFGRAYGGNSQAGEMLTNSLVFGFGSMLVALVLGTGLAYVQVRTDPPFKALFFAASLVPLIIPAILYAVAWIFLADPKIGLLNTVLLQPLFGHSFSIYGMAGMIMVQGFHLAPVAFMLMVAAFRVMDPVLEESALMSGARRFVVLRRITLPLMRPALVSAALLMFVQSIESFEVPAVLGLQHGTYVFTSRIYYALKTATDYGAAGAYALGLLVIAALGVLASRWLGRNSTSFQTLTGKAFRPRPVELGRWRWAVGGLTIAFFVVTVVVPVGVLVYGSLLQFYQTPSLEALRAMTLDNYKWVLDSPIALTASKNSLLLAIGSATIVMVLTAVAAWFVVKTKAPGRGVLDVLAFSPLVIPGLVLGLALLFVYLRSPLPVYGTLLILLIAYVTRYLPYGMRYASTALSQMSNDLEESAIVCGASWWQTFRRVVLPLASSGVVAGWIYIMVVSVRELSSSILIYSPGKEVLSVLMWEQVQNGQFTGLAAIGVCMIVLLVALVLAAYRLGAGVGVQTDD